MPFPSQNKLCSLRGAADPTSDASSVEASGFEFKLLKTQHSRKISEKLFEASWLDIALQSKERKGKGKKWKGGKERKAREGREGKETGRKAKRKEKNGTTAIWLDIAQNWLEMLP